MSSAFKIRLATRSLAKIFATFVKTILFMRLGNFGSESSICLIESDYRENNEAAVVAETVT
jgi:hypothetical protein